MESHIQSSDSLELTPLAAGSVDPTTITPYSNGTYPAIIHYNGLPSSNIIGSVNGLLSGSVLAYAGLQLFVEFLAEMRRPRDFLKVRNEISFNPKFVC